MASPGINLYRLPSLPEVIRILGDAVGRATDTAEVKAKWNLCKQLSTAYAAAGEGQKDVREAYKKGTTKQTLEFEKLLQELKNKPAATAGTDLDHSIFLLAQVFLNFPAVPHPGSQRYADLEVSQSEVVKGTIEGLKPHVQAIADGAHDARIKEVFGDDRLLHAKKTFALMFAKVEDWHQDKKIKLDRVAGPIRAAGLTNYQTCIGLAPSFFKQSAAEREAILAHEGTHAIFENDHRTDDMGGYIGSPNFLKIDPTKRIQNASHYEYVVRLLNGAPFKLFEPGPNAASTAPVQETTEYLRKAWNTAINLYVELLKHRSGEQKQGDDRIKRLSQVLGLSVHKGGGRLCDGDLAVAENRVGKLGVMMGAISRAKDDLPKHTPMTKQILIEKLIEFEGPLRKSADNKKTVEMIDALSTGDFNSFLEKRKYTQPSGCVIS